MENHIIELSEQYLFPNSPELIEKTKQNLEKIRFSYGGLYWDFYNSLDTCHAVFGCGTAYQVIHNFELAYLLEDIILSIYTQIERHRIEKTNSSLRSSTRPSHARFWL